MKKFIATCALLSTFSAVASESRSIYDIMYLPNAGTFYGFTTGEYQKFMREDSTQELDISGHVLSQTLGYAMTDRLSFQGSIDYASVEYDSDAAGARTFEQTGFSDPTVQARWRLSDESFRIDLLGGALIGLGDSEVETNNDTNNLRGGSSLFGGAQVGGQSQDFQWAVLGRFTRNMESTTKYEGAGELKDEEHNEWLFRADILNRLAEKSFLRSFLSTEFVDEYEDDQTPAGTTASSTQHTIGTEYQHLFSPDLLGRLGVDYGKINTDSGNVDDFSGWTFRVGANYQF